MKKTHKKTVKRVTPATYVNSRTKQAPALAKKSALLDAGIDRATISALETARASITQSQIPALRKKIQEGVLSPAEMDRLRALAHGESAILDVLQKSVQHDVLQTTSAIVGNCMKLMELQMEVCNKARKADDGFGDVIVLDQANKSQEMVVKVLNTLCAMNKQGLLNVQQNNFFDANPVKTVESSQLDALIADGVSSMDEAGPVQDS